MARQKIVIGLKINCKKCRLSTMSIAAGSPGVVSVEVVKGENIHRVVIVGDGVDATSLMESLRSNVDKNASLEIVETVKGEISDQFNDESKSHHHIHSPSCCTIQ